MTDPPRPETGFLSRRWLAELSRSLADRWPGPGAEEAAEGAPAPGATSKSTGGRLALGELVTSGPNGDVEYTIVFAHDQPPRLLEGTVAEADVVLVQTFETAKRIAEGEISPAEALSSGLIRLRGDPGALVRGGGLLAALRPSPPAGEGTGP